MKILLFVLAFLLMGFNVVQIPSKNLHVTWMEPSENNDGTPLTDLGKIVVQLTLDQVPLVEEEAGISGPTGGQEGFHTFLNVCETESIPNVKVAVWAEDTSGNRSPGTIGLTSIDCVPPGPVK